MADWNQWQGIGNLGRDPEMTYSTQGTAVTRFSIAVSQGIGDNKETLWVPVVCFKETAERMNDWLYKGCKVFVQGSLNVRKYIPKGRTEPDHFVEVVASSIQVLSSKGERISQEIAPIPVANPDTPF